MVTLKNGEVLSALMALRKLDNVKFSAPTSLKLVKLNKALEGHWQDVDTVRQQVVKEHAVLKEDGEPEMDDKGNAKIDPAKEKDLETALKALFEETFEVEDKVLLTLKDFEGIQIEPSTMIGLSGLFAE